MINRAISPNRLHQLQNVHFVIARYKSIIATNESHLSSVFYSWYVRRENEKMGFSSERGDIFFIKILT